LGGPPKPTPRGVSGAPPPPPPPQGWLVIGTCLACSVHAVGSPGRAYVRAQTCQQPPPRSTRARKRALDTASLHSRNAVTQSAGEGVRSAVAFAPPNPPGDQVGRRLTCDLHYRSKVIPHSYLSFFVFLEEKTHHHNQHSDEFSEGTGDINPGQEKRPGPAALFVEVEATGSSNRVGE
jgi:hypothetical protein